MTKRMFGAASQPVNLEVELESTIHWLSRHPGGTWLGRVLSALLPPRCRHCAGTVDLVASLDECQHCLQVLPWLSPQVAQRLAPNRENLLVERLVVPFAYRDLVAADLRELKFGADLAVAALYGALLAATSVRSATDECRPGDIVASGKSLQPDLLLPIPLHPSRLAMRGFNQAALIAKHAARRLHIPVETRWLQRRRDTAAQSGLEAAARQRNLQDAFVATKAASQLIARRRAAGQPLPRVAVIDDVLTTGATAHAAVTALRCAGFDEIQFWAVARTTPTNITSPTC